MKYLSVGLTNIYRELFLDIKNGKDAKFSGGIWATEQLENIDRYNPWVDYILSNPYILFYKNLLNKDSLSGVLITLKDDAKIFNLKHKSDLEFLKTNYPSNNGWIDFETLSKDYDAIYVNVFYLKNELDKEEADIINTFAVSSLTIFNADAISYYQKAYILIDKGLAFNKYELPTYKIIISDEKKYLQSISVKCKELIEKIKDYLMENNIALNASTYNQIKSIFHEEINNAIREFSDSKNDPNLEEVLIRKCFTSI